MKKILMGIVLSVCTCFSMYDKNTVGRESIDGIYFRISQKLGEACGYSLINLGFDVDEILESKSVYAVKENFFASIKDLECEYIETLNTLFLMEDSETAQATRLKELLQSFKNLPDKITLKRLVVFLKEITRQY